jgi:hypothetical protein
VNPFEEALQKAWIQFSARLQALATEEGLTFVSGTRHFKAERVISRSYVFPFETRKATLLVDLSDQDWIGSTVRIMTEAPLPNDPALKEHCYKFEINPSDLKSVRRNDGLLNSPDACADAIWESFRSAR